MSRVSSLSCPACGAPIAPNADRCPYCCRYLLWEPTWDDPDGKTVASGPDDSGGAGALFQRLSEPREHAFTLSVPQGWLIDGGILRGDVKRHGISAQFIEAKVDFTVKRDPEATVAIRWCPEIKYCDMRYAVAGAFFPPGANYQGMISVPWMSAGAFLVRMVFPWAHPHATAVSVVAQRAEPLLVEAYRKRQAAFGLPSNFECDGAIVHFAYTEDGRRFEEKAFATLESMGALGGGMWANKDTLLLRAPEGQLDDFEPILHHIRESVEIDHAWIAREIASQEILANQFLTAQQAEIARNRRMLEIQQQIQQMDRQITEHRMRTNAEIHNDAYLTLMDQEEYVNPYTGDVETGSNQWQHRWVTDGGEEFYTDEAGDDPNVGGLFNRTDWRRTPVRPRFPQTR